MRLREGTGLTFTRLAGILEVSAEHAHALWSQGMLMREMRPGYLDGPEEFYDYERWGDRPRPRRPGFGHTKPRRVESDDYDYHGHHEGGLHARLSR
jgi:hypothetical protein